MQQINKTVFTPWFMAPFFGTAALSLGAVVFALMNADQSETAEFWRHYLVVWTHWNHVRSVASIGSVLLYAESLRLMG